jgi:hypothetical protein
LSELCKSAEQLADTPKSPVGDKTQRLSLPAGGNGCKLQTFSEEDIPTTQTIHHSPPSFWFMLYMREMAPKWGRS